MSGCGGGEDVDIYVVDDVSDEKVCYIGEDYEQDCGECRYQDGDDQYVLLIYLVVDVFEQEQVCDDFDCVCGEDDGYY